MLSYREAPRNMFKGSPERISALAQALQEGR
jgi:hypothetical protein